MQVLYLQEPAPDYVRAAVTAAAELHATGLPGDVLIFLTGTIPPVFYKISWPAELPAMLVTAWGGPPA